MAISKMKSGVLLFSVIGDQLEVRAVWFKKRSLLIKI